VEGALCSLLNLPDQNVISFSHFQCSVKLILESVSTSNAFKIKSNGEEILLQALIKR
jgi:hypothetical protein